MENVSVAEKRMILQKFINVGINVTPDILNFILTLSNPMEKVNSFIKETSFLPSFANHLTADVLMKISEIEIQNALKRTLAVKQIQIEPNNENELKDIIDRVDLSIIKKDSLIKNEEINSKNQLKPNLESTIGSLMPSVLKANKLKETKKHQKNLERKVKFSGANKSIFNFNPIAKEYDFDFAILKDPTGNIHTNGEYDDFFNLTIDKFNQLYKLMKKRPETLSAAKITNILRNTRDQIVSVIGLVSDIHETKNNNYFLTIEDSTGLINVIIRRDSDNLENLRIVERTIQDQMVYIEGTYNPGEKGKKGVIFASHILKIDIPNNYIASPSPDPISIALLSDLHVGSKEFECKLWNKFIEFIKGNSKNKNVREIAGKIKYIIINGDLVDGIGIYPNQQDDLVIKDIYDQYKRASELFSEIPDYIKIFYSSGNHEPVRNALPRPAVPKKYSNELIDIGVKCMGNPALIQTHNVKTLVYHGDSILDMNLLLNGLENEKPTETMKEFIRCRHLAPIYGKKTQIAPTSKDWLVIDQIPDIFHTGHIHINGRDKYKNVTLVNSGCFQSQTGFMKSFGITPTPGIVPIVELDTYNCYEIDFKII